MVGSNEAGVAPPVMSFLSSSRVYPHRELRGDFRDRESGRLRRERRGARNSRIHLDDQNPTVLGINRELHVRAAGVHPDLAQHGDRGVAQTLILPVGQGLGRRHRDRVAGVNPHRVDVLDRAGR